MGRRTFGKGLVQNGFTLTDGSVIRLTIARYYTPTGRSIQRPYNDGYDKYVENFVKRYSDGEMMTADSIHFPDSLKVRTLVNKRVVYGGGGIMPDVFVSADTSSSSLYFTKLVQKNVLNSFTLDYFDKYRTRLSTQYNSFSDFKKNFQLNTEDIKTFIAKGEAEGVPFNEAQFNISRERILLLLKGYIATNIWQTSEFFQIVNESDKVIEQAQKLIRDRKSYNAILGYE
jgi:carboxyl-terminal processing protease